QDLYKRFLNPSASDARILLVVRVATVLCGVMGVGLAWASEDVSRTLTVPYSLLGVSLFVPIVAGLYVPRTTNAGALASIFAGIAGMLVVQFTTAGAGWQMVTPALAGLFAAVAAWLVSLLFDVR